VGDLSGRRIDDAAEARVGEIAHIGAGEIIEIQPADAAHCGDRFGEHNALLAPVRRGRLR
jgi:hypothetical protein